MTDFVGYLTGYLQPSHIHRPLQQCCGIRVRCRVRTAVYNRVDRGLGVDIQQYRWVRSGPVALWGFRPFLIQYKQWLHQEVSQVEVHR